jgi:hypothetical protein
VAWGGHALRSKRRTPRTSSASLDGVLAGIDYNDERKLGDAKQRDTVLARLVQHYRAESSRKPLAVDDFAIEPVSDKHLLMRERTRDSCASCARRLQPLLF